MARMCGILKIALREDEPGCKLRLAPEDVKGELAAGKPIEPGHYFCCQDAFDRFAPRVLDRLKKTPAIDHNGHPVLDKNGEPVMFAGANATLQTIDVRLLS